MQLVIECLIDLTSVVAGLQSDLDLTSLFLGLVGPLQHLLGNQNLSNLNSLLVLKSLVVQALGNVLVIIQKKREGKDSTSSQLMTFLTSEALLGTIISLIHYRRSFLSENCLWYINQLVALDTSLAAKLLNH